MASLDQNRFDAILRTALEQQKTAYEKRIPANRFGKTRLPFLIGRESDLPESYLAFWINPSQCGWKVGTRTTIERVAGGAIHHEWPTVGLGTQPSNLLLDNPIVSFSFQSGAIVPSGVDQKNTNSPYPAKEMPQGLGNFYDFINILNTSNITGEGNPNYVNIFYTSNVFPSLWLQGFFTEEGVNWDDGAENPNQITGWGASFMVFNSLPNIGDSDALRTMFETFGFQSWSP